MRGEEIEGQKRTRKRSSKTGTKTDIAMTPSVAEKANVFSAGGNKACSNGRSRTNECGNSEGIRTGDENAL